MYIAGVGFHGLHVADTILFTIFSLNFLAVAPTFSLFVRRPVICSLVSCWEISPFISLPGTDFLRVC